jgi:hypothetical protein
MLSGQLTQLIWLDKAEVEASRQIVGGGVLGESRDHKSREEDGGGKHYEWDNLKMVK